ncbi:A24 family peptidase [Pseudomonas putida]|uniref:prepilin peptidase n=1 Tax=Pseudomonas putida TaxID=303 RepID=UPI0023648E59|nr:A24 family peptidase [Pseudomonas putida]MDD2139526.1 A24 family peptidase [Pseudomonas putida]HDS1721854.1 prepilin peptidase [Pseudomonas putida]
MIEIIAGAAVGLIAGRIVREVAKRLPNYLFVQWRTEAGEILELDHLPHEPITSPGRVNVFQRGFIPEIATALLSAGVIGAFGFTFIGVAFLALTLGLVTLVLIDAEHQVLPDCIVLPMLWLGLMANQQRLIVSLDDALYGAVAGYMVLWVCLTAFKLVTGKDGMGRGDLKMLAMLGAWGGWQVLPLVFLLSTTTAALYGITTKAFAKGDSGPQYPFGPFLALGGYAAIIWGDKLTPYLL